METVTIDGKLCTIEPRVTKVGDTVYDKDTEKTFVAGTADVDDLNWVVVKKEPIKKIGNTLKASQISDAISAYENVQIKIGEEWYYITYYDLVKILKKSMSKLKVEKKKVRTWVTPI